MLTLFWFAVALIVCGSLVAFAIGRSHPYQLTTTRRPELAPLKRSVFTLQIGDIVQYEERDWVVEGILTYDTDGYTWLEYLLQDNDDIRWLSVEEDDRVEVQWLKPFNQVTIPSVFPQTMMLQGVNYRCVEKGRAKMTRLGNTLNRKAATCEYLDYAGEGGAALSVERWQDEVEVTIGYTISPRDLSLLPGDGQTVYRE